MNFEETWEKVMKHIEAEQWKEHVEYVKQLPIADAEQEKVNDAPKERFDYAVLEDGEVVAYVSSSDRIRGKLQEQYPNAEVISSGEHIRRLLDDLVAKDD